MIRLSISASIAFVASTLFAGALDSAWLKATTDKTAIDYKVGEEMVFTITPMEVVGEVEKDKWFLDWTRSGDDGVVDSGKVAFDGKTPFVYRTKIAMPGFVRLYAKVVDAAGKDYVKVFTGDARTPEGREAMNRFERAPKKVFADAGAGAEIESLRSEPEPKDFDEFWKRQFARLDLVPMKVDRVLTATQYPGWKSYAVRIECAGLRQVTGYLFYPEAAEQGGKFPCRLVTYGYNGEIRQQTLPTQPWVKEIVFYVNAHGMKLEEFGATEADRLALKWEITSNGKSYAHDPKQNVDPEIAYFNGMVLRVKRALQYLKTLPEWNGKDLRATGGSQGGLQTIWAAGCGEGVTLAESEITWCCDMYTNGKRLDPNNHLASLGWYIPWTEALGYYDAANWAKRIPSSCYTFVTRAGLGDYICPPTGLAKMWNNLGAPKKIKWVQGSQHGYVPPVYPERDTIREVK